MRRAVIALLLCTRVLNAMEYHEHELDKAVSECDSQRIERALRHGAPINDSLAMKLVQACLHKNSEQAAASFRALQQHGADFTKEVEKEIDCGSEKIKDVNSPVFQATGEALKGHLIPFTALRLCGTPFSQTVKGIGLSPEELIETHKLNKNPYAFEADKLLKGN